MIQPMGQSGKDETRKTGTEAPEDGNAQETPAMNGYAAPEERRKRSRKGWIIGVCILLVIAGVLVVGRVMRLQRRAAGTRAYTPYTVRRGDITVTLSGSGTLEPADSYTVTSLISGDILSAPFEEGDIVGKNQVLYEVDSSDIESGIKQAENNLKDSENKLGSALKQLDSLKLTADGTGSVIELSIEEGDTVQAGQTIAAIRDSDTMRITVLFQKAVAENFYEGQDAVVTLGGTYESYNGTVTKIGTVDHILTGNVIAREVTVDVANPGAFTPSTTGYLTINGTSSLQNGTFDYKYQGTVVAASSGTVSKVNVAEGSRVTKGEVIAVLHGLAQVGRDQLDRAEGQRVAQRLRAGGDDGLDGMGECVHARGRGQARRQGNGELRVEDRQVGHHEGAVELQLKTLGLVANHRGDGDLAAGARGGGDGDEGPQRAGEESRAFVVQQAAAFAQQHVHPLRGVHHAAAAQRDQKIAAGRTREVRAVFDDLHLGVGRHVIEDPAERHARPLQAIDDPLHQSGLAQDLIGDDDCARAAEFTRLEADLAHAVRAVEDARSHVEFEELWEHHDVLLAISLIAKWCEDLQAVSYHAKEFITIAATRHFAAGMRVIWQVGGGGDYVAVD